MGATMADDAILKSMRDCSDEELLAITFGAALGYTDRGRVIAEAVLRERCVELPPNLEELRRQGAAVSAEVDRLRTEAEQAGDRAITRDWGIRLAILGVGGFVLPFVGLQFRILIPFGAAIPIAAVVAAVGGYILVVGSTSEGRARARTAADSPSAAQPQTPEARPGDTERSIESEESRDS
jgi:hypothetical protein